MINAIDKCLTREYTVSMKSKDMYVKCRANGELSDERKVVSDLRFIFCISLHVTSKRFLSCRMNEGGGFFMDKNSKLGTELRLFRSTKVLAASSLLIAMSIVLGKVLAVNIGDSIRISFENLPIMVAGYFFGPAIGLAVGASADIVGCLIVGYSINPIITVGAASVGFFAGLLGRDSRINKKLIKAYAAVGCAHLIGSVLIKSFGMRVYFHTPFSVLALRLPLYMAITAAEGYVVYLLSSSKVFMSQLERVSRK